MSFQSQSRLDTIPRNEMFASETALVNGCVYTTATHYSVQSLMHISFAAQGMRERPVSVLASADASGVVILSICGAYRLITIDLRAHRSSGDPKGKERSPAAGGRSATPNADSPSKGRSRKSHSPGSGTKAGAGAAKETSGDISGKALRPLQLTLSADLSLLSALVEVDGYIELIQVLERLLENNYIS